MDQHPLSALLFPDISAVPADLEGRFPPRALADGARVTRMAPSPTGFMHLGNLYGAIADERLAHQSGGVFYLRIEDTDQKREVEGGVATILNVFGEYGLPFDEGVTSGGDKGAYGPYRQRQRREIYHICAKHLLEAGLAYPCFLTEEELNAMRETQAEQKLDFGCYGAFAKSRDIPAEEVKRRIEAGEQYVVRFRSSGSAENRIKVDDMIRGTLELPENIQDVVILKSDGIPTYHFAHVVDDHFMRTGIVVRGEEWLATLPIHVQLFAAMGWKAPKYLHTAHLMKMDGAAKRKLSKRKDPELALSFYGEEGYPAAAVKEYLMMLLNSNFEDWRLANPALPMEDFPFSAKKMGTSGALFDMAKLDDVSRNVIARMDADEAYELLALWALAHDVAFAAALSKDPAFTKAALAIGRGGKKPRKDITTWRGAKEYLGFFYTPYFAPDFTLPQNVTAEKVAVIFDEYTHLYNETDDADAWFGKLKDIAAAIGYAADMKEYKQSPENYEGNVGDVSMVVRIAVTGRQQSPDLREVMCVLGKAEVLRRLEAAKTAAWQAAPAQ